MSNMINAKPRFAVDDADGRVFCYLTNRYFEPTGTKALPDGTWDLAAVKAGILAGTFVDAAKTGTGTATLAQVIETENKLAADKAAKARAALAPPDKVAQANADFLAHPIGERDVSGNLIAGQQVQRDAAGNPLPGNLAITAQNEHMSPFQRAQAAIAARQKTTPGVIKAPAPAPAAQSTTRKA
jgi:hypothetical protein